MAKGRLDVPQECQPPPSTNRLLRLDHRLARSWNGIGLSLQELKEMQKREVDATSEARAKASEVQYASERATQASEEATRLREDLSATKERHRDTHSKLLEAFKALAEARGDAEAARARAAAAEKEVEGARSAAAAAEAASATADQARADAVVRAAQAEAQQVAAEKMLAALQHSCGPSRCLWFTPGRLVLDDRALAGCPWLPLSQPGRTGTLTGDLADGVVACGGYSCRGRDRCSALLPSRLLGSCADAVRGRAPGWFAGTGTGVSGAALCWSSCDVSHGHT